MNARVETTQNDERYYETDYTLFIMINGNPTQLPSQPCKDTTTTDTTAPGPPSTPAPQKRQTEANNRNRQSTYNNSSNKRVTDITVAWG